MNSRFAQILAECTGTDGRVDRKRLFDALSIDPGDPTAIVVDAAAYSHEQLEELKQTIDATVEGMQDVFKNQRDKLLEFYYVRAETIDSTMRDQSRALTQKFETTMETILEDISKRTETVRETIKESGAVAYRITTGVKETDERMIRTLKKLESFDTQVRVASYFVTGFVGSIAQLYVSDGWGWVIPAFLFLLTFLTLCGFFRWLGEKIEQ